MADLVVVIVNNDKSLQAAVPIEIYCKLADALVADFIVMTNLLDIGTARAETACRCSIRSCLSSLCSSASLRRPCRSALMARVSLVAV